MTQRSQSKKEVPLASLHRNTSRAQRVHEREELKVSTIDWLQEHGAVGEVFLSRHLENEYRDGQVAQSLRPHYQAIKDIFNELTSHAITGNPQCAQGRPTLRRFEERLRYGQKQLPERLREVIPTITDDQIGLLGDVYQGWRRRLLGNARKLNREEGHER